MQLKILLILLFALVALIPASLLTANSAYSIYKLQQQITNLYQGILVIIVHLDEGHVSLLQMKSDMLGRIISTNPEQMRVTEERIKQNELQFSDVLANYKEISDFPLQVEIMKRRSLDKMITDDHEFITQVRLNWLQFQATSNDFISLSGQNRTSEATSIAFGEVSTGFDKLVASYQKTVDLNKDIAKVLYEESNSVSSLAYLYSIIVFAGSFSIAVIVAITLSRWMISPIAQAQQRAKRYMDRFAKSPSITDISYNKVSSKPTQEKNDDINLDTSQLTQEKQESALGSDVPQSPPDLGKDKPVRMEEEGELRQHFNDILHNNKSILLHAELYKKDDRTDAATFSSRFLYHLISSEGTTSTASRDGGNGDANKKNNHRGSSHNAGKLVLITRAGSNLYSEFRRKENSEIYLLSMSTFSPITKSDEGLIVISLTNTALIAEAVRRTFENNPSATIIFDNITELANTIGFEKTHGFIHSLVEIVHPYPNGHIVVLINRKAHKQHEIQSIANIFNMFVE